jgi:hypothetical protein
MAPADCGGYAVARHAVSLATRLTVILCYFNFFSCSLWAISNMISALEALLAKLLNVIFSIFFRVLSVGDRRH